MPSLETFFIPENEVSAEDYDVRLVNRLTMIHYKDGTKRIFKTPRQLKSSSELTRIKTIAAYHVDQLLELNLVPEIS